MFEQSMSERIQGKCHGPVEETDMAVMTHIGRPEVVFKVGRMETFVNIFGGSPHINRADRHVLSLKEEWEVEMRDYLIIR